ncbi:hypothetical protein [Gemmatimonas sp.]|uniref:hypothetical protein n=1 Tax=Gemmatimonas sp. TaxID=1962908 RepID=UPI0039830EC5
MSDLRMAAVTLKNRACHQTIGVDEFRVIGNPCIRLCLLVMQRDVDKELTRAWIVT